MASSSSARPHSTPMPVGPSILWAEKARKSTPSAATSTGRWGTDWAPSATTSAPAACAASAIRASGLIVPSTLDMAETADQLRPVEQAVEVGQVEPAVAVDRQVAQLDAALVGQLQPRARGWRGAPSR